MSMTLPPDATPRDARVHEALDAMVRSMRQHHRMLEQRVSGLGTHRSQHRLLMLLSCMGPTASQKELADRLGVSPAAVARTLKTLEAAGLVEKTGGADSRRKRIAILPAGQRRIDQTHALFRALDRDMFEGIEDDELLTLTRTLEKVRENLDRLEGN